ncbi:amidohydrolase family protein (plasmid) [Mesorhizobium sp. ORM8.1]
MRLPTSHEALSIEEFDTSSYLENARRQAVKRNYKDFMIVDVDAHHFETDRFAEIIEYIDDPVLRQTAKSAQQSGRSFLVPTQPASQDLGGRITRFPLRRIEKTPKDVDPEITISTRWMDAAGIDYINLFPTPMLLLGLHPQPLVENALAWAYNRWLVERVLSRQDRIKSMLYLPFNDPDEALKIVEHFSGKPGVIGYMITTVRNRPVHDNSNMKVFRAIEERGLPIAFHSGFNWGDRNFEQANRFITVHALGFPFYNMLQLCNWITNGLSERFPALKVLWLEAGVAWLPFVMQRLDNEYMMRSSEVPSLKKRPSEYITDMFYGCQPMETTSQEMLEQTFKFIKAESQLLFCSDYPHWDFDLPSVIYDLPFLNESQKRAILGGNAQRVFNLPQFERKLANLDNTAARQRTTKVESGPSSSDGNRSTKPGAAAPDWKETQEV